MSPRQAIPVTICVLTYGAYPDLARRCIDSIIQHCDRKQYRLVVGANAVSQDTRDYLDGLKKKKAIDRIYYSAKNINKCPMMRRMFKAIKTEYIWWFDDDSYIQEATALPHRLDTAKAAPASDVLWGHVYFFGNENDFNHGTDVVGFVKSASWYKGLEPPSWDAGGKGEHNFEGRGCGDGRWFFVTGGNWWARTSALKTLDWPDPNLIKRNDDVFLCEAIRQQAWRFLDIGEAGVAINQAPRRGEGEDVATMELQMSRNQEPADLGGWFFPEEETVYRRLASKVKGGTIVELGVWKGKSLATILDICRENKNDLVAVDLWPQKTDDPDYAEANQISIYDLFIHNLDCLGHRDTVRIIREDTAKAARHFADGSVDLVFVDADHSHKGVKRDLLAWIPKLKEDGVLFGHDYIWKEGVRTALAEVLPGKFKLAGGSLWQMLPRWQGPPKPMKGCVFLPTFQDTDRLEENYHNRPELSQALDFHVYDDNSVAAESKRVKKLCKANGWFYHKHKRASHGDWMQEHHNMEGYNYFVWDSITRLGEDYDFVMKMDTDAYIIDADFHKEIARLLSDGPAIVGTLEHRPTNDVMGFWNLAKSYGYTFELGDWIAHIQGGIYAMNKAALKRLRKMGFMHGTHSYFSEDCYMSYSCMLLGIEYISMNYSGSWWQSYRPPLDQLQYLKAIHPLMKSEWEAWQQQWKKENVAG